MNKYIFIGKIGVVCLIGGTVIASIIAIMHRLNYARNTQFLSQHGYHYDDKSCTWVHESGQYASVGTEVLLQVPPREIRQWYVAQIEQANKELMTEPYVWSGDIPWSLNTRDTKEDRDEE